MVNALPALILVGAAGAIGLTFLAFWRRIVAALSPLLENYRTTLERADVKIRAEDFGLGVLAAAAILWTVVMLALRPDPTQGLLILPAAIIAAILGSGMWVRGRIAKRLDRFGEQLELVLRLMSSGMRAGLGLRQALVLVVDEAPEPARTEFARVLGQSNIGVSVYDALDGLAARMPSDEMGMLTRAIRVQSSTGGNLAGILDHLATTIKERRRVRRKTAALTAEGRATAWVVGSLPLVVGGFIMATQPVMRAALFTTMIGHLTLGVVATLELIAAVVLRNMLRIDP